MKITNRLKCLTGALAAVATGCLSPRPAENIVIRPETLGGRQAYVLENGIYKMVLVPELARFPLSLIFKQTGHDCFAQLEPLETPNVGFHAYGGIVDSLPWVSGKGDGGRLPDKGLLYSVPWRCTTGATARSAWFEGAAEIAFQEPAGGETCRLRYVKRVTGEAGSPQIRLDQSIQNIGATPARFTATLHARTAIAVYDAGDYLFVPGTRAYVSYMKHSDLSARGIKPSAWVDWPLAEAVEFRPGPDPRHVFVFTEADRAVAGDDKTGEALVFRGGDVFLPGGKRKMRMAVFMTNAGYLVEPGLTSCIEATPETWTNPENTIRLEPGESCEFSIRLIPASGVHKRDWPEAFDKGACGGDR